MCVLGPVAPFTECYVPERNEAAYSFLLLHVLPVGVGSFETRPASAHLLSSFSRLCLGRPASQPSWATWSPVLLYGTGQIFCLRDPTSFAEFSHDIAMALSKEDFNRHIYGEKFSPAFSQRFQEVPYWATLPQPSGFPIAPRSMMFN